MDGIFVSCGGFRGPEGQELVPEETSAIIRRQGTGLFDDDPRGKHGQLVSVLASGLAFVRGAIYRMQRESNPARAIETLDEWEDLYALPRGPDSGDTTDRQTRLKRHMQYRAGASLTDLESLFRFICIHPVTGVSGFVWICADDDMIGFGGTRFDAVIVLTDALAHGTGNWAIGYRTRVIYEIQRAALTAFPAHILVVAGDETTFPP